MPDAPGLLERLDAGPVICAEGYLFAVSYTHLTLPTNSRV